MKRKNKSHLGDDFGIRIYLSDGNYSDVTQEREGGGGGSIELTDSRLQVYSEVDGEEVAL